jgi:hypothetical protein
VCTDRRTALAGTHHEFWPKDRKVLKEIDDVSKFINLQVSINLITTIVPVSGCLLSPWHQGFLYWPVYFYRYPVVRVYQSGINGIPLLTAQIQIPNQNRLYKR